jgi:phytanoyl-CoA hydroxylase
MPQATHPHHSTAPDADQAETFFAENGYWVAPQLLPSAAVAAMRSAFTAQAGSGRLDGLNTDARITDPQDPLYTYGRMMHPHRHPHLEIGRLAMEYLLHPPVGEVLHRLLGEPAVAAQTMFYFKPPGARGQDLHQDNFYLRVRPGSCVAAWMAIDDADQDNGGLMVVPRSHRFDIICPEKSDPTLYFTTEHVAAPSGYEALPVNLKAGDVLFFHGSVIHGSPPNRTADRFRRAFICHYAPLSSEEISRAYSPLYTFDGQRHEKHFVQEGGPCGTVQEAVPELRQTN